MRTATLLLALAVLAPATISAQTAPAGPAGIEAPAVAAPVVTHHTISIGERPLNYAATVGETVLDDAQGKPAATIFSIAYVREGAGGGPSRPVVFLFNGGPGSSSSQLHLDAFGPMRPAASKDVGAARGAAGGVVPNPATLLTDADLVFIDPVGTGFSRVLPGASGRPFWTADGDARSILGFVRRWLAENGRTASPTFFCGESYGGFRLALMLKSAADMKLDGAIFLSPMLDMTAASEAKGNDLFPVLELPSMSAVAWYHHRIDRKGRSVEATFAQAARFAETEYAPALLQGDSLPAADRRRIAAELSARIGLPAAMILKDNLRVPVQDFVTNLLAGSGQRVGRTDGRYIGDAAMLAKNSPPYDDPAIAFGGGEGAVIAHYLESDLGFVAGRPYKPLAMDVNMGWDYAIAGSPRSYVTVAPFIGAAMRADPRLRLFVGEGYYDLATPMLATDFALDHADLPPGRVTERRYESGHSMYQHPESLTQLAADVRAFIRAAAQ